MMQVNSIYKTFLAKKQLVDIPTGLNVASVNNKLFDWQKDIVVWALKRGRACIFADCGLGKTPMQLSWADEIRKKKGDVLIVAPLAVATQTVNEGKKFGIKTEYRRDGVKANCGITITNYEMLEKFNVQDYAGVVLDESSILKSYTGKFRTYIIEQWGNTPFKLACTATPAPNDLMELANHSEFIGAMKRTEMLSMFFVHDGGETQKWRLKGHAQQDFWKWVCSWAVMIRKPSDLGYDDGDFILPPLKIHEIVVDVDHHKAGEMLFQMEAQTLQERQRARKDSTKERCIQAANIANASDESWLVWCDRNDESQLLTQLIDDCKEIRGSHDHEYKEKTMLGFSSGNVKRLVTKPSIAGFGMNWQHCSRVIFVGLSDSYEQFYQAIRRSWRFGQTKPVDCYIITAETEGAVVANIKRKEQQAQELALGMVKNMHVYNEENIKGQTRTAAKYAPNSEIVIPSWLRSVA
jgi:superfamily II DNA or RNA helicase